MSHNTKHVHSKKTRLVTDNHMLDPLLPFTHLFNGHSPAMIDAEIPRILPAVAATYTTPWIEVKLSGPSPASMRPSLGRECASRSVPLHLDPGMLSLALLLMIHGFCKELAQMSHGSGSFSCAGTTDLGAPTTPSMITCAMWMPDDWNSLARHWANPLRANFPQPAASLSASQRITYKG